MAKGHENKVSISSRQTADVYGDNEDVWFKDEANPDHKLVIINSPNEGFVSQMGQETRSFMLRTFTEKLIQNLENWKYSIKFNKNYMNQISN